MLRSKRPEADPVADFYRGKTISMVVGSSAGGGYDALARVVARYLGKHIPGNPSVIVRNMPGAGGIVATSFIANVAPRDGLTIGCVLANTPFEPLLGTKEATYDATKLTWLGTPSVETGLLAVWYTSKIKTLDDAKKMQMTAGVTGANSEPALYARLLDQLLGLKIKIIPGFPGQNDAYLAMERGELDTVGTILWSSLTSTKPDWIRDKKIRILLQYGPEKEAALPDVPYGPDLVEQRRTTNCCSRRPMRRFPSGARSSRPPICRRSARPRCRRQCSPPSRTPNSSPRPTSSGCRSTSRYRAKPCRRGSLTSIKCRRALSTGCAGSPRIIEADRREDLN